jgi:nucleoside-diphosphate-sugar epimerase
MRVFLTGGTGFIGRRVADRLRARGDQVVGMARGVAGAAWLREHGCEVWDGDLGSKEALAAAMARCDVAFHLAGVYAVGIPARERPAMFQANVRGTERVLDAAISAGVGRIVYVSTVNVFGNTRGVVVDETYRRPPGEFFSYYDETKYRAHVAAEERIAAGAPIVVAMPGGVYGPGDHSQVGTIVDQTRTGTLRMRVFPDMGMNLGYVDDIAAGIVLVGDRGRLGDSYVVGGEISRLGQVVDVVARLAGRRAPRFTMPTPLMRLAIPFGSLIGRVMGYPPNLRELISAADGVTYWATDAKARNELGYTSRALEEGLRDTVSAATR